MCPNLPDRHNATGKSQRSRNNSRVHWSCAENIKDIKERSFTTGTILEHILSIIIPMGLRHCLNGCQPKTSVKGTFWNRVQVVQSIGGQTLSSVQSRVLGLVSDNISKIAQLNVSIDKYGLACNMPRIDHIMALVSLGQIL